MTHVRRPLVTFVAALMLPALSACQPIHLKAAEIPPPPSTTTTTVPPTTTTTIPLVPWTAPVEHIFFHTLVNDPSKAFRDPKQGKGFKEYFVTVGEFKSILGQMDANGWTLVDIHKAVDGTVQVPTGRKPFVLSVDDVNYYKYENGLGLGKRLVLQNGKVMVEQDDGHGNTVVTDNDIVPLLDEFIAKHPEFSAGGAKGVLAPTGYEGLLGERVNETNAPDLPQRQQRVRDLATALKTDGWTFASHSYGHIDFAKNSLTYDKNDIERWKAEAEPLIGKTDIFIYPFGAAPVPTSAKVSMLRDEGYTIICDIDVTARITKQNGVNVMARRHIDGIALDQQHTNLLPMFDTTTVEDKAARS